ncbi:flavodoxin family protein [Candidatus Woesearchaeota archaeon]|nr:flavodoxin family protein [Candidatus Woesearchaeota archaeon]
MKKILVMMGHPSEDSFCNALADAYIKGAEGNAKVKKLSLPKLRFDPILHEGYNRIQKLEPDLKRSQKLIRWADHIVLVFPIWWGSVPALLKGFLDRTILPGFAFKYGKGVFPKKLLKGRTGHLIVTSGAPVWMYFLLLGNPAVKAMKRLTFNFCGIKVRKVTRFGKVGKEKDLEPYLEKTEELGKKLA